MGLDEAVNITLINDTFVEKLKGYKFSGSMSSAAGFADLVIGTADIVLEGTRKRNLELDSGYGLITEAGGVMLTLDDEDFGPKKYLEFGQDEHIPVISASTKHLAKEFINHILEP